MHTTDDKIKTLYQDVAGLLGGRGIPVFLATYEDGSKVKELVSIGYSKIAVLGFFPDFDDYPFFSNTGTYLIMTDGPQGPSVLVNSNYTKGQTNSVGLRVPVQRVLNRKNLNTLQGTLRLLVNNDVNLGPLDESVLNKIGFGCQFWQN